MVYWGKIRVDKPNYGHILMTFCQLFMWNGAHNEQVWLPRG